MYYLIIQLYKIEYKEDLLLALTSCGIRKGSLFEGQNLDKVLDHNIPLFSGFIKSGNERERYALMFTGLVQNKEQMRELVSILEEADIPVQSEDIMRLIVLPIEAIIDHETNWERKS